MKKGKITAFTCCIAGIASGALLDVWTDTLGSTVFSTSQSGAENVEFTQSGLSVTTTGGKDFLVLSSFTTGNNATDNNRQGRWQLTADYSGGGYTYATAASSVNGSPIYERWINGREVTGANEYGSVNMNGIYSFASDGSHRFDLQHRTNGGADINTQKGTMVVVGLNVAGTTLRNGSAVQDTSISNTGPTPYLSTTTSDS